MVDWDNLVLSPSLSVVGDNLVWHGDVPFRSVVLVSVVAVSIVSVVGVFESDSAVLILLVVGAVLNLVVSLVVDELVSHGVVLGLSALDVWDDLVDGSLLERSVV